jgi:CHAD domain-containing protein
MARSTSIASTAALPLEVLREQATALEASMLECLARPAKRSVHKLRTSTRRIQAQLELLAMLPELPPHSKPRQKLHQFLKKLRRAAGAVRDLDVQCDLLVEFDSPKGGRQSDDLRKEARELRRYLKSDREKHAEALLGILKQEKADLPIVFHQLNDALKPARSLSVSDADITSLVLTWYRRRSPAAAPGHDDVEQLHQIRKQAKLARYLAESAPESAAKAHRLAVKFEALQEAGGEWHDWLLFAELARKQLGDSALLPQRFSTRAEKSLRVFERRIAKMTPKASALPAAA